MKPLTYGIKVQISMFSILYVELNNSYIILVSMLIIFINYF